MADTHTKLLFAGLWYWSFSGSVALCARFPFERPLCVNLLQHSRAFEVFAQYWASESTAKWALKYIRISEKYLISTMQCHCHCHCHCHWLSMIQNHEFWIFIPWKAKECPSVTKAWLKNKWEMILRLLFWQIISWFLSAAWNMIPV